MIVTETLDVYYLTVVAFITGAIFGVLTKAIARAWYELRKIITKA